MKKFIKRFYVRFLTYNPSLNVESIQAYRRLRHLNNKCSDYIEVARRLMLVELRLSNHKFWGVIPNSYGANLDLVLRQRLFDSMLYYKILPKLMLNASGFTPNTIPLPSIWLKWLVKNGIKIKYFSSMLAFYVYQLKLIKIGVKTMFSLFSNSFHSFEAHSAGYEVIIGLQNNNLPNCNGNQIAGLGFLNWYKNNYLKNRKTITIAQSQKFESARINDLLYTEKNYYPRLRSNICRIKFLLRAISITLITLLRSCFGAWYLPILMKEAMLLTYFKSLKSSELARSYSFNNSNWIFRPLWTHYVETKKSSVVMMYYSTNMISYKWKDNTTTPIYPTFETMSWPKYAVWDIEQREFLLRLGQNYKNIEIVGPIDWEDSCEPIPELPSNSVGVFDVSIYKDRLLLNIGYVPPYYTASLVRSFLLACHRAITLNNKVMVLKTKRKVSKSFHSIYSKTIKELKQKENVIILDSDISASRIIDKIDCFISIPYTSTALIAASKNKPSAYYDAAGSLKTTKLHARNIEVFNNISLLSNWLKNTSDIYKH
tara:strand:+ start:4072 stop:5697 length:1626 start_codon:yes stop_codon:yes gene_type:complete